MAKRCVLCNEKIREEYGKFRGSIVKAKNMGGVNDFIYVCSHCQKKDSWKDDALVKSA